MFVSAILCASQLLSLNCIMYILVDHFVINISTYNNNNNAVRWISVVFFTISSHNLDVMRTVMYVVWQHKCSYFLIKQTSLRSLFSLVHSVKFQECQHLNTRVNPHNYRFLCVQNMTHFWNCDYWRPDAFNNL